MIRFYFHPTPNPAKIALFLEEAGLSYEVIPVDTSKGEQHTPEFRAVNPNGKVPAIIDTDGPGGEATRVFDSTAILLYLAEKTGTFLGESHERPELLSWLLFIASGLGPFSGQAVHFQFAAPAGNDYAVTRYRREAERHYKVLDDHLEGRTYIVGNSYTIADMSAWGWLDRANRVLKGLDDPFASFPNLRRLFKAVDSRPAAARARDVGKDHPFKKINDEETKRALFPSNYDHPTAVARDTSSASVSRRNPSTMWDMASLGFSHISVAEPGRLAFLSGQIAATHGGQEVPQDVAGQAKIATANLAAALEDLGASVRDTLMLRVYIVNATSELFGQAVAPIRELFKDAMPSITTIGVQALYKPEIKVEIEMVVRLA